MMILTGQKMCLLSLNTTQKTIRLCLVPLLRNFCQSLNSLLAVTTLGRNKKKGAPPVGMHLVTQMTEKNFHRKTNTNLDETLILCPGLKSLHLN